MITRKAFPSTTVTDMQRIPLVYIVNYPSSARKVILNPQKPRHMVPSLGRGWVNLHPPPVGVGPGEMVRRGRVAGGWRGCSHPVAAGRCLGLEGEEDHPLRTGWIRTCFWRTGSPRGGSWPPLFPTTFGWTVFGRSCISLKYKDYFKF